MPHLVRWWCWSTAVIGLVIMVLDYVSNAILGTYFDEHAIFDAPDDMLQWVVAFLGLVLLIGGCVAGAAVEGSRRSRRARKTTDDRIT
ncbi:MAG: hypothetical protein FWD85_06980 [Microbacteriaceae bacterium]|nr:hypothetical protein [Microbacteriaceae bacterium]